MYLWPLSSLVRLHIKDLLILCKNHRFSNSYFEYDQGWIA